MKSKPSVARFLGRRRVGASTRPSGVSPIPSQIGPVRPMTLILMSLVLLAGIGAVTNSFASSGLISLAAPPSSPVNVCDLSNYLNCYYGYQYNQPTGCTASAANCQTGGSGGVASILNPNSPFTPLFTGNPLGFTSALVGATPLTMNAYQAGGLNTINIYPGRCTAKYIGNMTSGATYITTSCSEVDTHGVPLSAATADKIAPNPYAQNQTAIPMVNLKITNSSSYLQGVYYQSSLCTALYSAQTSPGTYNDIMDGCQFYFTSTTSPHVTTYWFFTANVNSSVFNGGQTFGGTRSFNYCNSHYGLNQTQCPPATIPETLQPENWDVYSCGEQLSHPNGADAHQNLGAAPPYVYWGITLPPVTPQCLGIQNQIRNYASNTSQQTYLSLILVFIGGAMIFLLSSGITFGFTGSFFGSGGGIRAGTNSQGSRLGQAIGLFLLVWIPLYSEFGAWVTSGLLGSTGLEALMLFIIYGGGFFGTFWQILSYQ